MSTRAYASIIIPLPLVQVWKVLRDFTFPAKLIPGVESCEMEGNATSQTLGGIRITKWKEGGEMKHTLIGHSDLEHSMTWELIDSNPPAETLAHISCLRCKRITETNDTFVEWHGEFSSGTKHDFVLFEQQAYHRNLNDVRAALTRAAPPVLYHVHEGPSTRVAIVAAFLGIPLQVKLVSPDVNNTEFSADLGGVVTKYVDGNLLLLESGSTVMHLIEKHDKSKMLDPFPVGSHERAKYLQWFFYSSSTMDHLLFEAYKQLFVLRDDKKNPEFLDTLRKTWFSQVIVELEAVLSKSKFICGDNFSGADIMCGWSVHFAQTIGWLDDHPILAQYLARLHGLEPFHRAFVNYSQPPFYLLH